jgi:hypothetical protein
VVPISIFSANPTGAPLVTRPPGLGGGQPRCTPSIVVVCVCTNLGSLSAALQGQLDGAAQQQQLSWGRSGAAQRHQQQPGRLGSSSAGAGRRGSSAAAAQLGPLGGLKLPGCLAVCLWPGAVSGAVAGCGGIRHTRVRTQERNNKKRGQLGAGGSAAQECGRPLRLYCLGTRCRLPCFGGFFCCARQRLLGESLHLSALSERPRLL